MRNLREDYYDKLLQLSRDRAREELMPYSTGPTSWGKTIAQHLAPGRGRPLSDDERRVLLTLAQELIDLARSDRATMVRAINTMVQSLITRGMQLPGFRDEIEPLREWAGSREKETNNGSFGAIIEERVMKSRTELKAQIRKLLRENEMTSPAQFTASGLSNLAREQGISNLASDIAVGRSMSAVRDIPMAARPGTVEFLELLLDAIKGDDPSQARQHLNLIAPRVVRMLVSMGLLDLDAVGDDALEPLPGGETETDPKRLVNGAERRGQRVSESQLRREIRRALREQQLSLPGMEEPKNEKLSPDQLAAMRNLFTKLDRPGQVNPSKWDELLKLIDMAIDVAATNSEAQITKLTDILTKTQFGRAAAASSKKLASAGKKTSSDDQQELPFKKN